MRISECTLDMAEQFALEQGFGDGAGIDGYHRLPAAKASCVNLLRQHVLACAVLTGNEHGGIRGCNLIYGLSNGHHRHG